MKKPTLEDAILLAVNAHNGQKDKIGRDYILHPLWVMNHIDTEKLKIIAVLHDVVEDTEISIEDLCNLGYSTKIIDAIDALTKRPDESRHEYLDRIMENILALEVKKVDIKHNSSEERLNRLPESERDRLINKYTDDIIYLTGKSEYIRLIKGESGNFQSHLFQEHERLNLENATVTMLLEDFKTMESFELDCNIVTGYTPLTLGLYKSFMTESSHHKRNIITNNEEQFILLAPSDGVINVVYDLKLTDSPRKLKGYFMVNYEDGRKHTVPSGGEYIEIRVCEV